MPDNQITGLASKTLEVVAQPRRLEVLIGERRNPTRPKQMLAADLAKGGGELRTAWIRACR